MNNMKATILRGIPASGKTTYASKLMMESPSSHYINKDALRDINPGASEKVIAIKHMEAIEWAAERERDVIIDNTHTNEKTVEKLILHLISIGYAPEDIEVIDVFEKLVKELGSPSAALAECCSRNAARDRRVPESVIFEMYLSKYPTNLAKIVVFDIDGTLANIDHRLKFVQGDSKDWKSFFEAANDDEPYEHIKDMVNSFMQVGIGVILLTGRPNTYFNQTFAWLVKHKIGCNYLLMRNEFDKRPDTEMKSDIYDKCLAKENVLFVVEDRQRVIDMRKSKGVHVLAVDGGSNH